MTDIEDLEEKNSFRELTRGDDVTTEQTRKVSAKLRGLADLIDQGEDIGVIIGFCGNGKTTVHMMGKTIDIVSAFMHLDEEFRRTMSASVGQQILEDLLEKAGGTK